MDEIPYDFVRKRLSVVTANAQGERTLITKGALDNILSICTSVQSGDGIHPLDAASAGRDRTAVQRMERKRLPRARPGDEDGRRAA